MSFILSLSLVLEYLCKISHQHLIEILGITTFFSLFLSIKKFNFLVFLF